MSEVKKKIFKKGKEYIEINTLKKKSLMKYYFSKIIHLLLIKVLES